jgi:uncharacterized membrane protein YhaH (DUF805 family)
MECYFSVIKKYAVFKGRASRAEFWCFFLVDIIIAITSLLSNPSLFGFYFLFSFLPNLSLRVRRLHDVGRSGWLMPLVLIPIVNIFFIIYFIFLCFKKGDKGKNIYGNDPIMEKQKKEEISILKREKEKKEEISILKKEKKLGCPIIDKCTNCNEWCSFEKEYECENCGEKFWESKEAFEKNRKK